MMQLTICGSHENWCREGHSFLMGVNEITFMCVQSAIMEYSICSHLISSPTATSYKLICMKENILVRENVKLLPSVLSLFELLGVMHSNVKNKAHNHRVK